MKRPFVFLLLGFGLALAISAIPADAILFSGATVAAPPSGVLISTFDVYNSSGSTVSNQPVTLSFPVAVAGIVSSNKYEVRKSDGTTVVTTQEDGCSTYAQDGSRKNCVISIVEPDSILTHARATYKVYMVSGSPSRSANVTTANITGNTSILLKSTFNLIPNGGTGTAESGTWDFLDVNYVLGNCTPYNGSTGYGANPICGWDITFKGPNRYGIHLFQYARRESDSAVHNWLRTDMWVDFWGSGSTPCPCSVSAVVSEPNSWGKISSGTVGGATMTSYVFGATLYNGANVIAAMGGPNDPRTQTVTFDHTSGASGAVVYTAGGWQTKAIFIPGQAVAFSGGTLPAGLTASQPYFLYEGGNAAGFDNINFPIYTYQCLNDAGCPGTTTITTNGSGTITATALTIVNSWSGQLLADTAGKHYWISAAGTVTTAPPMLAEEDFTYLTQSSHATPPYITNLFGTMLTAASPTLFYTNTYVMPQNVNVQGDDVNDDRIGYIDRNGAISLFNPFETGNTQNSDVYAAAFFSGMRFIHQDEKVGLPPVFNDGPAKDGVTYPAMGAVQPTQRIGYNTTGLWTNPDWTGPNEHWNLGSDAGYGPFMEMSHMPSPAQAPFIRTGNPEWNFQMVQEAIASVGSIGNLSETISGTTYYRPVGGVTTDDQVRGIAWSRRAMDQAHFFIPDADPASPYLHDLIADSYADYVAVSTSGLISAAIKSLGYNWAALQGDAFFASDSVQWWQEDFNFQAQSLEAIRGEFSNATTFVTTYYVKQVIGRMDQNHDYGGGVGCFWAGPARYFRPLLNPAVGGNYDLATLVTTWVDLFTEATAFGANITANLSGAGVTITAYGKGSVIAKDTPSDGLPYAEGQVITGTGITNPTYLRTGVGGPNLTTSQSMTTGTAVAVFASGQDNLGYWNSVNNGNPPWAGCGSQTGTWISDQGSSSGASPEGLVSIATASAGIASWLSIANASSIYTAYRTPAYAGTGPGQSGLGLSFTDFLFGGVHYSNPAFAFGPSGATN